MGPQSCLSLGKIEFVRGAPSSPSPSSRFLASRDKSLECVHELSHNTLSASRDTGPIALRPIDPFHREVSRCMLVFSRQACSGISLAVGL